MSGHDFVNDFNGIIGDIEESIGNFEDTYQYLDLLEYEIFLYREFLASLQEEFSVA